MKDVATLDLVKLAKMQELFERVDNTFIDDETLLFNTPHGNVVIDCVWLGGGSASDSELCFENGFDVGFLVATNNVEQTCWKLDRESEEWGDTTRYMVYGSEEAVEWLFNQHLM